MSAQDTPAHPRHHLDPTLGHPVRFSLMAVLAQTDEIDFATLRDHLQVSDSVLSKQVTALESAGYVRVRKGFIGKRPRTWLKATKEGESVWQHHLAALRQIAGEF
ncbi:winged helix-turn-helix domain-containing protein [Arthrobacter agilis]|uniref:winged helix-turn-helix domain-containing protein n=1 Tax=Arthrobacter agilis TaxID=37921 RepID=UPI002788FCB0|nr:transcriptional regulator [Arthrobacter agilis]MDQ0736298.1 DNA-binding MarR family transcriptional regulator [Arthrobacter agilis]